MASSQISEGIQGIATPQRLLVDEKTVFNYIEEMLDILQNEEQKEIYIEFLLSFTNFKLEEPHIDSFIRRILAIIEAHITLYKISNKLLKKIMPVLAKQVLQLINLRYNSAACKILLFNSKDMNPLWFEAAIHLLNISTFLINPSEYQSQLDNFMSPRSPMKTLELSDIPFDLAESGKKQKMSPENQAEISPKIPVKAQTAIKKKPKPSITIPEDDELNLIENANPKNSVKINENNQENEKTSKEMLINDKELQEIVWREINSAIQQILLIDEKSLGMLEKYLFEEVYKKSQDLGIYLVNEINKTLLPYSTNAGIEKQAELIKIIDSGCTLLGNNFNINAAGSPGAYQNDALSKHCLNILIEICEAPSTAPEGLLEVQTKIARLTTPVFILRCKEVIKKYLSDEKRNGLVPLPRYFFMIL